MQANLVLCIGVALILAAFGGQATVRVGSIIMAGVAAIALGLFVYMQSSSRNLFLQGTIDDFDFNAYSLNMRETNQILGIPVPNPDNWSRSRFEFVIFNNDIHGPTIEVALARKAPTSNQQKERVLALPVDDIKSYFGGTDRLVLDLREEGHGPNSILTLFDQTAHKTVARERETESIAGTPFARTSTGSMLVGLAFAQQSPGIDVPTMLERLKSEDTTTRRAARDALSQAPLDSLPVIMKTFGEEYSNYQVKLGVCVALTEMLRADKNRAEPISRKLTEDDLNRLLDAAGDTDRTVRVYAAEFLYDLGDTRTTKLAIPRAAQTTDDNARYNWLLVSQDGWRKLSPADKAALADPLNKAKQNSGRRTLQLFDKLQTGA
jgi:hypothetical protein